MSHRLVHVDGDAVKVWNRTEKFIARHPVGRGATRAPHGNVQQLFSLDSVTCAVVKGRHSRMFLTCHRLRSNFGMSDYKQRRR